ncbi:amidase family protein [Streptomyces albulus]|nr:amidase family protein [Streptomyces noursei]
MDGIPYTAKDSYLAKGLTAAAGSPAFEQLIAQRDAFAIERLRAGGAVLIGLTNMPPMANGGMQRGVYGRAESPYSADWLTSAYGSGSSNGSGTATAASFGAFGLGEETWSSGRAPASNNALCAYTPSRGVISVRGNWPLVPTMDVVVPHTRTMADLLELLDVVVADDPQTRGDLWRAQPWWRCRRPRRCARPRTRRSRPPTPRRRARPHWPASGSASRRCTSTPTPRPERTPRVASAARPVSGSTPAPR